jgi:uncharacterized lipoprotein YbaY
MSKPSIFGALCASVVAAGCAAVDPVPPGPLTVSGELTYDADTSLPPDAVAVVELRDVEGILVAETRRNLMGRQVPVPFTLSVARESLTPAREYALRGGFFMRAQPLWVSDPVPVELESTTVEVGEIVLERVDRRAFFTEFDCGGTRAEIGVIEDRLELTVGGETFVLESVQTASGTGFAAMDAPETSFWTLGESATLTVRGETYPECVRIRGE